MLELFFAFLFLLLVAAAFPFLVLFDTCRSIRTAPPAAHALARGAARCNAARSTAQALIPKFTAASADANTRRKRGCSGVSTEAARVYLCHENVTDEPFRHMNLPQSL